MGPNRAIVGTDIAEAICRGALSLVITTFDLEIKYGNSIRLSFPLKSIDPAIMRTLNILPPALDTMTSAFSRLSNLDTTQFGKGMLSAVQGLIFASDAMLGLQTGKISTGKSTMDPNDYFGVPYKH